MPAQEPNDLDAVLDALYGRPLDEFVAARDAAVRQATDGGDQLGAQRIKRLRKPSVAAWVVNHVARDHSEEVAALAELGDELRAATADRDRGRIRALDHLRRERTEALVGLVRKAGEVGGRPVSTAVLDRLTETLTAAVMDPDAAAVVRAGRLSRALQHVGFGIVDEQGEDAELVALRPAGAGRDAERAGGRDAERAGGRAAEPAGGPEDPGPEEHDPAKPGRGKKKSGGSTPEERAAAKPRRGTKKSEKAASGEAGAASSGSAGAGRRDGRAGSGADDLADAERAVDETAAHVDRLEARRDDARERIRAAEMLAERRLAEVERLDREIERLDADRDEARRAAEEARTAADEARTELDAVDDELDDAEGLAAEARRRRREARHR